MNDYRNRIATYYSNARFLIKQGNAKDARLYVLAFVNIAYEIYKKQTGLMDRARTQYFLKKWVGVAQTLREKGIDDTVRACFGLNAGNSVKPVKKPDVKREAPKKSATPKINIDDFMPPSKSNNQSPAAVDEKPYLSKESPSIGADGFLPDDRSQGWAADIFELRSPSIISLTCRGATQCSNGTGFIISKNGYFVTNDHVVYDDSAGGYFSKLEIRFADGKKKCKAYVVTSNKKSDVALCRFEPDDIPETEPIPFIGDYSNLKQGADILVIGNGLSMGLAPFTGTVKFTHGESGNLVYTAPSNPGDSGGPVFNRKGECVGINKSVTVSVVRGGQEISVNGLTNATPADKIVELLKNWSKSLNITL